MADVNDPGPDPENPYAYTGQPPHPPPAWGPPGQAGPPWQPPPPGQDQPARKSLWIPALVGCAATIVLLSSMIFLGLLGNNALSWIGSISGTLLTLGFVACLIMLFPKRTRRWAGGLLLGGSVGLGVALVILAGVCVVALASYSSGT